MNASVRRIGLGLFVATAAVGALLLRGDGPPPDDADLLALPAPVPDHKNGFLTLSAATELLQWPEDDATAARLRAMARGEDWDEALAELAVVANEPALHALARVARNAAFRTPKAFDPAMSRVAYRTIDLSRVLALRALAEARRGDREAAIEDASLLLRTGSKIASDPNMLLYSTLGLGVSRIGLRAFEIAAPSLRLDHGRSLALSKALRAARPPVAAWRAVLASEYRAERELLLGMAATGLRPSLSEGDGAAARFAAWLPVAYVFQPNNSLAELAARIRAQQARASGPCPPPPTQLPPLTFAALLRPNALGHRDAVEDSLRDQQEIRRCAYDARVELTSAALGLLAFEAERGVLPPQLGMLVPDYLDAQPTDPFSTGSLRFDRAQRVIYSIGSDRVDEGGRAYDAGEDDREPRLVLPRLAPAS